MVMTMMDNKTALDMISEADKYILVDSENVGSYWLDMFDQEKENDDDHDAVVIVIKQFGQKQGLDIYHAIKPHLDEFYSIK